MKKIIFLLFIVFFHSQTLAAGKANSFEVHSIRIEKSGKGFIRFTSDLVAEPPACTDAPYKNSLSFDTNTDAGRAIYSMALTAQASGKKIYALGTGACETYHLIEDWSYGYLGN